MKIEKTPIIAFLLTVLGAPACVSVSKEEALTPGEVALAYEESKGRDAEEEYGAVKYLIPSARNKYTELVRLERADPDRFSVLSPMDDARRFELRILWETVEDDTAEACVRDVYGSEFGPRGNTYGLAKVHGNWLISHLFKIDFDVPPGEWVDIGSCIEGWLETVKKEFDRSSPASSPMEPETYK